MKMKRLLVTGASGFLGWNVCQYAQESWEVYGTYYSQKVEDRKLNLIKVNLTNLSAIKTLFSEVKPDAILHLAAQSKPNICQTYPEESHQINVTASLNITRLCAEKRIPLVFTSTDLVFDGKNPPYQETAPLSPINIYGEQKAQAEQEILTLYPQAVICRMPLMFGSPSPVAKSFLQGFKKALEEDKELNLFTDEYRTPVSALTAAKGLLLALEKCQGDILHLGGKERISRYEFGRLMAQVFQLPLDKITPCQQANVPMAAPRPADVSLESSKAYSLGYSPFSVEEELRQLKLKE